MQANKQLIEQLLVLEIVQKIAYACLEEQYNTMYEQLTTSVVTSILEYYRENWHDIRDERVLGLRFSSGSFMNTTNNHLERLNGHLKAVIKRNSSLEEFLDKFYVVMTSLRSEHFHKVAYEFQKAKSSKHVPNPQKTYSKSLARYAADLVLQQIALMSKVPGFASTTVKDGVYVI